MKKIILCFGLILLLTGCEHTINDHGKVVAVEQSGDHYIVTLIDCDTYIGTIRVKTTTLYQVGDIIKFKKEE